jgi:hypothetical protein
MSAWIVTKDHIDVLVQAIIVEHGGNFDTTADNLGQMLWNENHESVNARYREDTETLGYAFVGMEAPLDPVVVLKAINCYDYQSCEHDGWEGSEAKFLMDWLRERLAPKAGLLSADAVYELRAYSEAPWGIDRREQAIAKTGA